MKLNAWQYAIARGRDLYPWQIQFLEAFSRGYPSLALTCNGAGKTTELAGNAVEWFFKKYPRGWLVATSSSFNQLQNQTWPAIETRIDENYVVVRGSSPLKIKTPAGGEGVGFATNDAGRAEGWHPKVGAEVDPVMVLIDEGKTVPDAIWAAFDRCTVKYFMGISSAGPPMGRFFDGFNSLKKYYYTIRVPYTLCPHIDEAKVERMREIHGEDSPTFRSMMLAEFTEEGSFLILSPTGLSSAQKFQPASVKHGGKVAFFDFARGGDENTFTKREGNTVTVVAAWREADTVKAVRRFIQLAKEQGFQASQCWGDADGLGGPMVDQFHDQGFRINEFHGGAAPQDTENYTNLISECWIQGARRIERGDIRINGLDCGNSGEIDPTTFTQMTTRLFEWDKRGKKKAESKEDMAKRGLKSPDRGDGVFCCIMLDSHMAGTLSEETVDASEVAHNDFGGEVVEF